MSGKLKILLLEDSTIDASLIERLLRKSELDFDFRFVSNKVDFLTSLDEYSPDVILSDNSLPSYNATEALTVVRQRALPIPFILITGTVSEEFAATIIKLGADDYILKDRMVRLPAAIDAALKQRRLEKEKLTAQKTLAESEEKYRNLVEQAFDAIIIYSLSGGILDCNHTACDYIGYTRKELKSLTIQDLFFDQNQMPWPLQYGTLKTGHPTFDYRKLKRRDGSWLEMEISTKMMPDGNLMAIARDITERKIIEDQLIEREQQLELFIEHSPVALAMFDNEMKYISVSQRWITDYKLADKQLAGRSHYEVFPTLPDRWKEIHQRCLKGEIAKNEDDFMEAADGTWNWLRWEIRPWYRASQEIGGIIIFTEDITDKKVAAELVKKSEEKYRTIFLKSPLPIWIYDFDTLLFLDVNESAIRHYGYSREEFLKMTIRDIRPSKDQPLLDTDLAMIQSGSDTRQGNWTHLKKNGDRIIVETTAHQIEYNDRKARMVIAKDITEKIKAEEELRRSEERLNEAQAITHISNWEIDLLQNLHSWSDESYRIFGLRKDEIPPTPDSFLSFVHPDDVAYAKKQIAAAFADYTNSSMNFRFLRKDGKLRHGYAEWRFEFDKKNRPIRLFGILQDITERKEAEEERKNLQLQLLDQQRQEQLKITATALEAQEKERTAIGIELHDNVNQILVGCLLSLSVTKDNPVKSQQYIDLAMEHIKQAIEENRKIAHVFVAPDTHTETLTDLLKKLADKMLKPTGIKTKLQFRDFNEERLNDKQKINIYRIAQEQCTNITKYAKASEVKISLATANDSFIMTIADNGLGMDASKKITGIGLQNIKGRLSIFNGRISIETAPGKGFKIEIEFPL